MRRAHPGKLGMQSGLICSIRRECLDHIVIFGEAHLRQVLKAYAAYYNQVRTHLAPIKDAPFSRPVHRFGDVIAKPMQTYTAPFVAARMLTLAARSMAPKLSPG